MRQKQSCATLRAAAQPPCFFKPLAPRAAHTMRHKQNRATLRAAAQPPCLLKPLAPRAARTMRQKQSRATLRAALFFQIARASAAHTNTAEAKPPSRQPPCILCKISLRVTRLAPPYHVKPHGFTCAFPKACARADFHIISDSSPGAMAGSCPPAPPRKPRIRGRCNARSR